MKPLSKKLCVLCGKNQQSQSGRGIMKSFCNPCKIIRRLEQKRRYDRSEKRRVGKRIRRIFISKSNKLHRNRLLSEPQLELESQSQPELQLQLEPHQHNNSSNDNRSEQEDQLIL